MTKQLCISMCSCVRIATELLSSVMFGCLVVYDKLHSSIVYRVYDLSREGLVISSSSRSLESENVLAKNWIPLLSHESQHFISYRPPTSHSHDNGIWKSLVHEGGLQSIRTRTASF